MHLAHVGRVCFSPSTETKMSWGTLGSRSFAFSHFDQVYVKDPNNQLVLCPDVTAMRQGGTDICWPVRGKLERQRQQGASNLRAYHLFVCWIDVLTCANTNTQRDCFSEARSRPQIRGKCARWALLTS